MKEDRVDPNNPDKKRILTGGFFYFLFEFTFSIFKSLDNDLLYLHIINYYNI